MFLLGNFESYKSEYEKGAMKVAFRSNWITVSSKDPYLNVKPFRNYDLYFSKKGVLLHSFHIERDERYKRIYSYNKNGRIISVNKLVSETNELKEIIDFQYDKQGRIERETYRSISFTNIGESDDYVLDLFHSYDGNKEEILRTSTDIDEPDHTFYITYDENGRMIEEKIIRDNEDQDLVSWYKRQYNLDGQLVKEISLDSDGREDGTYEYLFDPNRVLIGKLYHPSENSNGSKSWRHDYIYAYNERGHWISHTFMRDGAPSSIEKRIIEYYK